MRIALSLSAAGSVHLFFLLQSGWAWIPSVRNLRFHIATTTRKATPFEADFYDNPFEKGFPDVSPLTVPSNTKLVVGLNKYSHDTSICAADASTGQVLFALSKERISRFKHDSGNVASLVETCLESLDLNLDNIEKVVMNNHHHRILPLEQNIRHLEWECGLQINAGVEEGYDEPENLLFDSDRHELSHHLAHAYSVAAQAPFSSGLCVIMDGMGETYRTMLKACLEQDSTYTSDLSFGLDTFQCIPSNIAEQAAISPFDFREAESVYVFAKTGSSLDLRPVFKRFTPEKSPPTLYNHGFENMESVGALYSRASSHIFGDWNACGKVMGLAPWAVHTWKDEYSKKVAATLHTTPIMSGRLHSENEGEGFKVDRSLLEGIPLCARNEAELFGSDGSGKKRYDFDDIEVYGGDENAEKLPTQVALEAISLAHRIQTDLEAVVIDFVRYFKEKTGQTNLCLAGGVSLNSVLNGRLSRELGFEKTFIPPYPGDDGIAIGCCAFGLFGNTFLDQRVETSRVPMWNMPLSPYLGPHPTDLEISEALDDAAPWLDVETVNNQDKRLRMMVEAIETGAVVAWYHKRSEIGPRALGHRSILADPRKKELVRFINESVKSRESFRPFAPSVLSEEASKWFELGERTPADGNISPYMSITATVRKEKRDQIPAVTHVDGSSRLQTVTKADEPTYHALISRFFELTGVPMVLNTSFNTLPSEPIVESPRDALRSFLYSMRNIDILVMGPHVIKRKQANLKKLLGEITKNGKLQVEPLCPRRTGVVQIQTSFELGEDSIEEEESVQTTTKVRVPDRPLHAHNNEWFTVLDDLESEILSACDGTVSLNDMMNLYSASTKGDERLSEEAVNNLAQNIVHRLVRLYDHTIIYW